MAYRKITIDYINKMIADNGFEFKNLKMCELGNQFIKDDYVPFKIAKDYYESLGVKHTSIDWNGRNGAIPLDFNKAIDIGQFDVITNVGFIEHVKDEEQCNENIHNLAMSGGIIIHVAPMVENYVSHNCYRRYDKKWFLDLAKKRNYTIIDIGIINPRIKKGFDLIRCTFKKVG
jgi:hypothetical protein